MELIKHPETDKSQLELINQLDLLAEDLKAPILN